MRWFLGLVLVVALILGVAYGAGRFLLPNTLSVTRTVTIERPRASVYAMINDLRIAKEWSPYYAMDPDAEYAFSGPESGAGQNMRWTSRVRAVGSGRMSIVDSSENESVTSILELRDRAAVLNSQMDLRAAEGGAVVSWTVTAECAAGTINVPCRYMNFFVLRREVQTHLDRGLAALKDRAEQLPNINFEGLNPQFDTLEPRGFIYSVVETSATDAGEVARAEAIALDQVRRYMGEYQLVRAGPLMRVVLTENAERMSYRVGYPYSGPRPLTVVGAQIGETPAGPMMHVLVEGDRRSMQTVRLQMDAYLQAHRIGKREDSLPWYVFHDASDGGARVEIFMPLDTSGS